MRMQSKEHINQGIKIILKRKEIKLARKKNQISKINNNKKVKANVIYFIISL